MRHGTESFDNVSTVKVPSPFCAFEEQTPCFLTRHGPLTLFFNMVLDTRRVIANFNVKRKKKKGFDQKDIFHFFGSLKGMFERNVKFLVHF